MQTIKRIAEDLALIGHPLNDEELIIHVLNGLGSTSTNFVLQFKLMTQHSHLKNCMISCRNMLAPTSIMNYLPLFLRLQLSFIIEAFLLKRILFPIHQSPLLIAPCPRVLHHLGTILQLPIVPSKCDLVFNHSILMIHNNHLGVHLPILSVYFVINLIMVPRHAALDLPFILALKLILLQVMQQDTLTLSLSILMPLNILLLIYKIYLSILIMLGLRKL